MHEAYETECYRVNVNPVCEKYFYEVWTKCLEDGVIDPSTGTHYTAHVRKNSCRGFSICDECEYLVFKRANATTPEEVEAYTRALQEHQQEVKDDRAELARIARLCKIDDRHVGFMIDAVDKQKFGLPTTESQSKCLSKMDRVIQKLTGVQWFKDDSIELFSTLPDVPLGGNLTLTILAEAFKKPQVKRATDLYINFDGASDNVCYHVMYGLAYFLRQAKQAGWPLQRVHILRFKVGHTHNQLDGTFGLMSRNIYGRQRGGTTARDLLSFTGFKKICKEILGDRYVDITEIRAVYNWRKFFAKVRPRSADRDLKLQFSVQMESTPDASIRVRTSAAVSAKVRFGPWQTMMPHPDVPASDLPGRDDVPDVVEAKEWPEFEEKISPNLLKFYRHQYQHPVHIPVQERDEMIQFLVEGPSPATPPSLMVWEETPPPATTTATTATAAQEGPPPPTTTATATTAHRGGPAPPTTTTDNANIYTSRRRGAVWKPFLQPRVNADGKTCKCGSRTHLKITHASCPMNPRRKKQTVGDRDSNDDSSSEDSSSDEDILLSQLKPKTKPKKFPYPIGTSVCVSFTAGLYVGSITKLFHDEGLCQVQFTDGDVADYDADEITYAKQLYDREFPPEE